MRDDFLGVQEEEVEDLNVFQRLIGVLISPGKVMAYLDKNPTFAGPLILIPVVLIILYGLSASGFKEFYMIQMEQTMAQTGQEAGSSIEFIVNIIVIGTIVFAPILAVAAYFLNALYFWVMVKIFGGDVGYKKVLSVVVHAAIISLLGTIIGIAGVVLTGDVNMQSMTSAVSLLPDEMKVSFLGGFLSVFKVFSIWSAVVIGIGLNKITNITKGKCIAIVVIGVVFIGLLLGVNSAISAAALKAQGLSAY